MAARTKDRAPGEHVVGSGLTMDPTSYPVDLARRMLDLGVASFECGDIKVTFAESAVNEAAERRRPEPAPIDSETAKRIAEEAKRKAREEDLELEMWSVS
jgi:hypothetical protein